MTPALVLLFTLGASPQGMASWEACTTALNAMPRKVSFNSYCLNTATGEVAIAQVKPAPQPEQLNELAPAAGEHVPPLCSDYYEWKRREERGLSVQDMLDCGGDAPLRMDNSVDGRGEA